MLNRRNLRIKAMQTLYAFQQIRTSNQQIAWERFEEAARELEEVEPAQVAKLKQIFKQQLTDPGTFPKDFPVPLAGTIEAEMSAYNQQVANDLKYLRSQMLLEVEGIHKLFFWVLGLLLALADYEGVVLDKKKSWIQEEQKVFLKTMISIELLRKSLASTELPSWSNNQDRLARWYKEISSHQGLIEEFDHETNGLEAELKKLRYIFRSILWKSESFQIFFEEYDRDWVENKDIIKSLVNKTLKSITEDGAVLAPLSYQWEDDKQFFEDIFDTTLKHELWSEKLIADCAKNWETDRIAQVDMILLKMALSEMINFPSIPVKVTINEYIEMSKKYSTPKSKKFINGLLDVLANDLMANGTIKKSGRGLIDNK